MQVELKAAWMDLFQAWNQTLEEEMTRTLGPGAELALSPDLEFAVRNSVMNSLYGWEEGYRTADGHSAADLLATVTDLSDAVDLFELAARHCSQEIPEFITFKLGSFGSEFLAYLMNQAQDFDATAVPHDGAGFEVPLMALHLLAQWQAPGVVVEFLKRFSDLEEPALPLVNILYNFACYDLAAFKVELMRQLDRGLLACQSGEKTFTVGLSYMMYILADVGSNEPEEAIYDLLRRAYRAMPDKIMGALALVQYGDRRAVTLLRHSLLTKTGEVLKGNRALYSQTLAAIRELGGQVDDLI